MPVKNCTVNCELNSEPVFVNLPIRKLSKTQRNRVSLQFTDRMFGILLVPGPGYTVEAPRN